MTKCAQVSLPEIGSNNDDGTYINDKVVWKLSEYSYGLVSLGYADRKGVLLGVEGNYILNNNNEGNARLYSWGSDGLQGGVTHTFYFGQDVFSENVRQIVYQILRVPPKKRFELITDLSVRERINYQRVNLLPNFTLRTSDVKTAIPEVTFNGELGLGNVHEESSNLTRTRMVFKSTLNYDRDLDPSTKFDGDVYFHYANYSLQENWLELKLDLLLTRKIFSFLQGKVGYSHYFSLSGASPFRFENYQYFPKDGTLFGLELSVGASRFAIQTEYNLPDFTPRDIDYSVSLGFHCYELMLKYRAIRNEFLMGVNLLSTN